MAHWSELLLQRENDKGEIEYYFEPYHVLKDVTPEVYDRSLKVLTDAFSESETNDESWDEPYIKEVGDILSHLVFMQWREGKSFTEEELGKKYQELIVTSMMEDLVKSGIVESYLREDGELMYGLKDGLKEDDLV